MYSIYLNSAIADDSNCTPYLLLYIVLFYMVHFAYLTLIIVPIVS